MNKKHSREDILEKGLEIIRTKGFNNTGVNDILKASNIPKGSFYNFFCSKEEFGIQLLDYYGKKNLHFIDDFLSKAEVSPLERLKNLYHYLSQLPEQSSNFGGCLIYNMASEMGGISDAIAEAVNRNFLLGVQRISRCIEEAQEAAEISKEFDAKELAEFMHTAMSGSMARAKAARTNDPLMIVYKHLFKYIQSR